MLLITIGANAVQLGLLTYEVIEDEKAHASLLDDVGASGTCNYLKTCGLSPA